MSSEQHMITTHYGMTDFNDLTRVPSDEMTRERTAKKWQLIMAAFVAVSCAMIGVQFFA